ncbi:juvenile hormone epoxide hydrolase-like [Hyposmocoma kahamanoa]|uniref:juvenile hormone epoxide hydrolase-like n=1 Tax=Hyposmocoma kahamanoa TaxID=1477025 RepID=UPI000E6DA545|nr:juvenile hormone epoxide hydrolase-like [Hyposmocoma kahamanoa]
MLRPARLSCDLVIAMAKLLLGFLAAVVGVAVYMSCKCCNPPKPPNLSLDEWWGPNELKGRQDTSIRPFQIKFSEEMIKDLKERLNNHRPFTPPLEGIGFQYGFNTKYLDNLVSYWAEKYPFADREKFLNQFPQFKTNIQGLDIHFIRVKPQVPPKVQVLPILLLHGWPGSVREFYEAIPLLTKQTPGYDFAFEVIVPSLPGYGFSDAAVRPGLGVAQAAVIMKSLMNRLGYKKYYVQGGDWGAAIVSAMAKFYPEEVLGHHSNALLVMTSCTTLKMFIGAFFPSLVVEPHLADRMYPLSTKYSILLEEMGYAHLHATKPDTIGVALADSPSGLLAYIVEKFSTWTVLENRNRPDGGLNSEKFSKDQLIDNLMIYWISNSITTSMRFYAEYFSDKHRALDLESVECTVPTWALQAKNELTYQPPGFLKTKYKNLIDVTVLDEGGHFFAFELPKVFTEDVFKAVKAFKEWHAKASKTEL